MRTLLIDTATERAVLALLNGEEVVEEVRLPVGLRSSHHLVPQLEVMLDQAVWTPQVLQRIAIGVGPGSYTGIRVGVSVAQGMAYVLRLPLVAFPSLCGFIPSCEGVFAAAIDARMGGCYVLRGEKSGEVSWHGEPELVAPERWNVELKAYSCVVTPNAQPLQARTKSDPALCKWEERWPDVVTLAREVEGRHRAGFYTSDASCNILYLRTAAYR